MRSITKYYGSNRVLDGVDFSLKRGEIHALLGENGAGKTTLMNILRGMTHQSAGDILIDGNPVVIKNPTDSARCGIGMVHQHFLLVHAFTVEENLILAGQRDGLLIDRKGIIRKASSICEKLGWTVPFAARVADLTVGVQQRVEILKALLSDAKIVLFDEPTAVLTPLEVDDLLNVLRALRDEGRSLVFVSHKLGEVMALCDRVTILRRGRMVGDVAVSQTNTADLARRMVGQDSVDFTSAPPPASSETSGPGLSVRNVSTKRRGLDDVALQELSFDVAAGQILGFAGVDGNGQEELFETLAGVRPFSSGEVAIGDLTLTRLKPSELNALGISLIPPDRQRQGLALTLSVRDNLLFDAAQSKEYRTWGLLSNKRLSRHAERLREEYDVRTDDLKLPVSSLSGGNQQKIVIARALSKQPKIVLAASPTRGLDVAAAAYVHDKLRKCRDDGAAIVLISTELDEVIALSDQIAVLYEGRIAAIVARDTPRQEIGQLMGGKQ
jgi:simple sugar transport system ATP-binding protein